MFEKCILYEINKFFQVYFFIYRNKTHTDLITKLILKSCKLWFFYELPLKDNSILDEIPTLSNNLLQCKKRLLNLFQYIRFFKKYKSLNICTDLVNLVNRYFKNLKNYIKI